MSLTTALFFDLNGRPLEKQATKVDHVSVCESALLSTPGGSPVEFHGYGRSAGHRDVYLEVVDQDVRTHWTRAGQMVITDIVLKDGAPHPLCSRGLVRRKVAQLGNYGVSALLAAELELYIFEREPMPALCDMGTGDHRQLYRPPPDERMARLVDNIVGTASASGIEVRSTSREYEDAQYEFALTPAAPLKAADDIAIFREIVATKCREVGVIACFLPKPFRDKAGSGLHLNLSVPGPVEHKDAAAREQLCEQAAQHLLEHARACCGIWAPSVNSYRRLGSSDFSHVRPISNDGRRDALIRIVRQVEDAFERVELRVPDCLANPHASIALCLESLVEAREASTASAATSAFKGLPGSLPDALAAMEKSEFVTSALGRDFQLAAAELRKAELDFYFHEVCDLDYRFNGYQPPARWRPGEAQPVKPTTPEQED